MAITASSVPENALSGSTVGVLSVVGGSGSYTYTKTADPDAKFVVSGSNLNTAAGLNYEDAQSHSVTISASNGVDAPVVRTFTIAVTNVFEQPSLSALTLPSSITTGTTVAITGATAGSTITGTLPAGWSVNSGARTVTVGAVATGQAWTLVETLADSANSPRTSTGTSDVVVSPTYLPTALGTPTFALGTKRLIAGATEAFLGQAVADGSNTAVGFDVDGKADTAAMSSLILCQQWTDQSGSGNHAIFPGSGGTRPALDPARTEYASTPIIFDGIGQVAGQVARRLAVTGLSLSRQAHSIYVVMNPRVSLQANALWEFRNTGGATRLGVLYTSPTISGLLHLGNATNQTSAIRPRAQVSTIGFTSSASARNFYLRETSASVAADTAATIGELHLGASLAGGTFNTRGDYLAVVCYPVAHTALESQSVIDALNAIYAVPTTFTHRIVGLNDSIMEGFGVRRGLLDQLARSGAELFNMGIYGELHSTAYTNRAARFAGLYTSAYGDKKCVFLNEGGINDVAGSVATATLQTSITDMHTYLAALGSGASVCRMTMIKNSGVTAGKETVRTDVNSWIVAGSSGANAVADVAALSIFSNTGDATYYLDGAHPTTLGYAGEVSTVNTAIDAAMI